MAVEKDQSALLPEPPPPNPARRDAAIAAALRRFDGADEPVPSLAEQPGKSWAKTHRPQLAILVSAMLLVVIGIPAALIGLRTAPRAHEEAPSEAMIAKEPPAQLALPPAGPVAQSLRAEPIAPVTAPATSKPAEPKVSAPASAAKTVKAKEPSPASTQAVVAAPAPPPPAPILEAAPPPPPPPPPPPAPPAVAGAEKTTGQAIAEDLVVTGSRVPQPSLEARGAAKPISSDEEAYQRFLPRLQTAFERGGRQAIIKLVAFPLRVNFENGPQLYRDRRAVERDFDRIFTAKVRKAVLDQRADKLFVRDQGAMVGDGELWFREACLGSECSSTGSVGIVAVNP